MNRTRTNTKSAQMTNTNPAFHHRVTLMTLVMTMGIVFGDIGTSPLYVMKAILNVNPAYDADYVIGAVSCVIWTLTLQTTLKYVVIALRTDHYWLIHVEYTDSPDTLEYDCKVLVPHTLFKINIRLGFRVNARVNVYFRQIVEDMQKEGLVDITSGYPSLQRHGIAGNFRFVIIHRNFSPDSSCSAGDRILMKLHSRLKRIAMPNEVALGLDTSTVIVENVPLIINTSPTRRISKTAPPGS